MVLSQQDCEAEGSLSREVPGWVGAALTKPWRAGTARRRGCGERGGKAYARNRRLRLSKTHRLEPGGSGPDATRTRLLHHGGGELPGMSAGLRGGRGDVLRGSHGDVAGAESDASSAERSTSEHGNHPCLPGATRPAWNSGLGPPSADRPGVGRSRRSSPRPGEPVTWRRAAAVRRSGGCCNTERRSVE